MLYEELPYPIPETGTETGIEAPNDEKTTKEISGTAAPIETGTEEDSKTGTAHTAPTEAGTEAGTEEDFEAGTDAHSEAGTDDNSVECQTIGKYVKVLYGCVRDRIIATATNFSLAFLFLSDSISHIQLFPPTFISIPYDSRLHLLEPTLHSSL